MKVLFPLWSLVVPEPERKTEEREDERICGKNLLRRQQHDVNVHMKVVCAPFAP